MVLSPIGNIKGSAQLPIQGPIEVTIEFAVNPPGTTSTTQHIVGGQPVATVNTLEADPLRETVGFRLRSKW